MTFFDIWKDQIAWSCLNGCQEQEIDGLAEGNEVSLCEWVSYGQCLSELHLVEEGFCDACLTTKYVNEAENNSV